MPTTKPRQSGQTHTDKSKPKKGIRKGASKLKYVNAKEESYHVRAKVHTDGKIIKHRKRERQKQEYYARKQARRSQNSEESGEPQHWYGPEDLGPVLKGSGCCARLKYRIGHFVWRLGNTLRAKWLICQGIYPPRGGKPERPGGLHQPKKAHIADSFYARQLKAALDIRIIRYPEPFAELLLSSHHLEPKNFKIMVNKKPIFYSYDYSAYIPDISHFVQTFSQIILDPDDKVCLYQECFRFPNEFQCLTSFLDCRICKWFRNPNHYVVRAPNGYFLGKINRSRPAWSLGLLIGFYITDRNNDVILRVKKQLFCQTDVFTIVSADRKVRIGRLFRREVPNSEEQLSTHRYYDYRILLEINQNNVEIKFLLVGLAFFMDFLLDTSYRPFIRYGSKVIPTYESRFSQ